MMMKSVPRRTPRTMTRTRAVELAEAEKRLLAPWLRMSAAEGEEPEESRSFELSSLRSSSQSVRKEVEVGCRLPSPPLAFLPMKDLRRAALNLTTTEAEEDRGGEPESVAVAMR